LPFTHVEQFAEHSSHLPLIRKLCVTQLRQSILEVQYSHGA